LSEFRPAARRGERCPAFRRAGAAEKSARGRAQELCAFPLPFALALSPSLSLDALLGGAGATTSAWKSRMCWKKARGSLLSGDSLARCVASLPAIRQTTELLLCGGVNCFR